MTVHVHKAGVLSAFGHDHEIAAPIASGSVDASARKVELQVRSGSLEVKDPNSPEKDRAQVQSTMLGPEVLDAEHHPEIVFRSTSAESAGQGLWKLQGNLTLHGQSRPITVDVRESEGHYEGTARLKQTEFGIKPVKVGGGAVRVKDEVEIQFNIHLAR
jgi:polyisoprenoid-binding protein YceI